MENGMQYKVQLELVCFTRVRPNKYTTLHSFMNQPASLVSDHKKYYKHLMVAHIL